MACPVLLLLGQLGREVEAEQEERAGSGRWLRRDGSCNNQCSIVCRLGRCVFCGISCGVVSVCGHAPFDPVEVAGNVFVGDKVEAGADDGGREVPPTSVRGVEVLGVRVAVDPLLLEAHVHVHRLVELANDQCLMWAGTLYCTPSRRP